MKTPAFDNLIAKMNASQKDFITKLAEIHADIVWDGGSPNTTPLRVSLKDKRKDKRWRNFAAINTRKSKYILIFEFKSKDYNGSELKIVLTNHKIMDRAYNISSINDIQAVSEILINIKSKYFFNLDTF